MNEEEINIRRMRLERILKSQGNYKKYVKYVSKGKLGKAISMIVDIIERYPEEFPKN